MNQNNPRPRGRARQPQQQTPQTTQQRHLGPRVVQHRAPRMPQASTNPVPRLCSQQQVLRPQVEQITSSIRSNLKITDTPIGIGRGLVRGRREINIEYYRAPRPESSLKSVTGKQGMHGQPVKLISNYFPITSYSKWSLYQYDVTFNPPQDIMNVRRGLLLVHKEILGTYIFDGAMLFSNKKYDDTKLELTSKRSSDDQIVIITVSFIHEVDPNDYSKIQIFNILLRNCLRHLELQLVGRNYYDAKAEIKIPNYSLKLWPGYETTIGMFDNGLLLRAEISTKVMREDTALDFLKECLDKKYGNSNPIDDFKAGIIGTIVLTTYNNKTYRIDDVDEKSNTNSTFKKKDGSQISYANYYKERYNLQVTSNQPMLVSKKKKSFNNDEEDLIYLIPQFCALTGMTDAMRNNFKIMKELSNYTRVSPTQRIDKLNKFMGRLSSTPESMEAFKRWNLTLSNQLIEVPGRVLLPENIFSSVQPYSCNVEADWTNHLRSFPMYACAEMKRWAVVTPAICFNDVNKFLMTLKKVSDGLSFKLPRPDIYQINDGHAGSYIKVLEQLANQINPSFILCVVNSNRSDIYNTIKRKLCIDRSIPSQVVTYKNVQKNNMSVCTKIAIQINCKIGGAPWYVKIPVQNLMIIGYDVCHDTQKRSMSYGGFVATMNETHTSYYSCVQPHEQGEEISNFFAMNICKALNKYKLKNGKLPSQIIIYRDGVGDGQLSYVHKQEINDIKKVLTEFYSGPSYELAFIVVKKRINTRFFVNSKNNATNPLPGTVIDSVVTDPSMYDFYLISQNVRQGTVTPTHYNIIHDNLSNWSPDKMQRLTYKLCHMYYNWSGTVRVPSMCQLAHKLAFFHAQTLKAGTNTALDELLYYL